jgi:hypothetical protein
MSVNEERTLSFISGALMVCALLAAAAIVLI